MNLCMPHFDLAKVLIVGDVMLDRYWQGPASRISPEAPVPIVKVDKQDDRPGGAANVALNIAALGGEVSLIGVIGNDSAGREVAKSLVVAGVTTDFQIARDKPTITKLRVISRHQQLLRLDFEEPFCPSDAAHIVEKTAKRLPDMSVLVLSDYAKGTLIDCQSLIALANRLGKPVLVDPKGAEFEKYRGATILTPNIAEFEAVVGRCSTVSDIVARGLKLIDQLDISTLLITRGEAGMTLLRKGEPELHLPARAVEVYDVTGAGDTVIAILAASLATHVTLPQSVALANLAAGIVVGKLGTASVSPVELRHAIIEEQGPARGVVHEAELLAAIEDARANGEKIVFTNGCFDIIHAGHVGYLEQARQQGDRLIVAINSDKSVKRLKGEGRPINPLERRMAVIAGLESVDWVISFNETTPERLLSILKPDVLVKGGDYREDQVVGREIITAYGGVVHVLNFIENCSTTSIVNRIREREI